MSKYDPALEKARQNSAKIQSEKELAKRVARNSAANSKIAYMILAKEVAAFLHAQGLPDILVVHTHTRSRYFRKGRQKELAGWLLPDEGHGREGHSKRIYLISDGSLVMSGWAIDQAPLESHREYITKALRDLKALHSKEQ